MKTSLRSIDVFSDLSDSLIDTLTRRHWKVNGREDSPIYLADDSANLVYFLFSGRVRIFFPTTKERSITLDFLRSGSFFGEQSLNKFEIRGEAAETMESSTLGVIPSDFFRTLMDEHSELSSAIFDYVNRRRWHIQNRLKMLAYEDARKRLIYVLLDLADLITQKSIVDDEVTINMTHQQFAEMSGLARPTVTKLLNALEEEKYLSLGQGEVHLNRPIEMRNLLGSRYV